MSRLPYGVAVSAALVLAGCGHSPSTTLHVLTAAAPSARVAYAGPPVRVEAVHLPPAYDRLELLRETAPGRYAVEEFDRWAAPPSRLARQALEEDLALRLPAGTLATPGSGGAPVTAVSVEVLSFSPGPGASALSAIWSRGCRPGEAGRRASVQLQRPGGQDAPEALGAFIAQLADRIAADLASAPDLDCRPVPPVAARPAPRIAPAG